MSNTTKTSGADKLKWLIVFLLLAGGVVANVYFASVPVSLRIAAWLVLLVVVALVAVRTAAGHKGWLFAKEARSEVRRVVWPTRQETIQMTGIVILMVIIVALILWGFDSVIMVGVGWLTGHGG